MDSHLSGLFAQASGLVRIIAIIVVIGVLHLAFIAVRHLSSKFKSLATRSRLSKTRTIASLGRVRSSLVFTSSRSDSS